MSRLLKPACGALAAALLVAGCAVGDNYERPAIDLPASFRGAEATPASIATADWREVFADPALSKLIDAALAANLDLASAEARVREAQAAVVVARAGGLPTVALGLQTSPAPRLPGESLTSSFLAAGLLNWEIDLWGRVRRSTEAARADLAAVQALREGVQTSLVAQIASRHLELSALHEVQAATEKSAQLQRDSLRLMRRRNQAGIVSSAEVRQAEGQLAATEARLPDIARQIAATENALSLLLARPPVPLPPVKAALALPSQLPAGLPSSLLERRPDLRQAEQQLIAANARVGAAKAQMLPTLSITGAFGRLSSELSDLLGSSAATVASLGPNATQTLYAGGALRANRDLALARLEQALIAYRATALGALREVADALDAYRRSGEQALSQQARVTAQREALRLADKRFAAGVVSFIEVLDAQRQLLAAETDLVNTQLARQLAYVQVYRALGGGWSQGTSAQPARGT
jgi:outer membrane protein, multidrug efflux system